MWQNAGVMRMKTGHVLAVALIGLAAAGCHRQQPESSSPAVARAAPGQGAPAATPPNATAPPAAPKDLEFHGDVRNVDSAAGVVEVRNDDVPGWGMPPMTMTYHVSNPGVLASLKAGDRVSATVHPGDFERLYDVKRAAPAPSAAAPSASATPPAAEKKAAKDELPPISYVCPSAGEENEINDKPGTCEKSPAKLVPIRLTIAYECLKGPAYIQAAPGVCRYDKSELAPITASMFWTCGDDASTSRFLEPGTCTDGKPREEQFEKRPHGDHNPRHGGPYVAMSSDLLHHVEGTFVPPGVFRAYFYDEYTRPMAVAGYVARLAPTDSNAKKNGQAVALHANAALGKNVLEVRIPNAATPSKDAPLHYKMHVTVKPGAADWTSDWDFVHYSVEPGVSPAAPASAPPKPSESSPAPAAAPRTTSVVPPAASPAGTSAAAAAPAATPGAAAPAGATAGNTMAGGAEISAVGPPPQDPLPSTTAGLLQELKTRTASVSEQLSEGNLAGLWLDALRAKDVAIALDDKHASDLAAPDRPELSHAARVLTETAWQIDAAGDLGQAEQIGELQKAFAAASSRIQSLYETSHR